MKAKFGRSGVTDAVLGLVLAADAMCVFVFLFTLSAENLTSKTVYGILTLIFTACAVALYNLHGSITADEKALVIFSVIFGKTVRKKVIEYSEIDGTECGVKTEIRSRWGGVSYTMVLTIKMKDGSETDFSKVLNIGSNFPASEPDKYKKYISEQPLMQLSHYIDSKLHLNASA